MPKKPISSTRIKNFSVGDYDISPDRFVLLEIWKNIYRDGKVIYEVKTTKHHEQTVFSYPSLADAIRYYDFCRKHFVLTNVNNLGSYL